MISFKKFSDPKLILESFNDKDLSKALNLILISLDKRLDSSKGPLMRLPGVTRFKNASTKNGFGVQYFSPDMSSFRLNFSKKMTSNSIDSIDIFSGKKKAVMDDKGEAHIQADVHIDTKGISIAKIIPFIAKQINKPKAGKFKIKPLMEDVEDLSKISVLLEAKKFSINGVDYNSQHKAQKELRKQGHSWKDIEAMMAPQGKDTDYSKRIVINVTKGSDEVLNTDIKEEKKMVEKIKIDPNVLLDEHIPTFTGAVAMGLTKTLIVCGTPGIGKCLGVNTLYNIYKS